MKALLALILLASCATPNHFEHARAQSFFVQTKDGHGSGVAINEYCVLTVAHVLSSETVILVDDNGHTTPAVTRAVDAVHDLGVACAPTKLNAPVVRLAKTMPLRYAPVFAIGNPLTYTQILTEGRYQMNGAVSAPIAPGSSGGGVFNADGELIGLSDTIALYNITEGVLTFAHLQGIVEVGDIAAFLQANQISYSS